MAADEWQSTMRTCKTIWRELRGVPLLPLANGKAGIFSASISIGGGQKYILGTRRQQGLMPQLKGRFVHPKASRRLQKFFNCDDFLQMMGIARFTPAFLATNLGLVLPRGWKGEKFVGWKGGAQPSPSAAEVGAGGWGGGGSGNAPPKAAWLALFWSEVSLLDVATIEGLGQWPLVPITTGELVSCSMLQQIVRACPSMLNMVKMRGLGVGLAAVRRAEAEADERDEKELQEILARQAQESAPTQQEDEEEDPRAFGDGEWEEGDENEEGVGHEGEEQQTAADRIAVAGASSDPDSEDETSHAEGNASFGASSDSAAAPGSPLDAAAAATPLPRPPRPAGEHGSSGFRTPPRAPLGASAPRASLDAAPSASLRRGQAAAAAPQRPSRAVAAAATAAAVAAGAAAGASAGAAAAVAAAVAAPVATAIVEPPRLKGLVGVLRRLGVPVLELAFFPAEQRPLLVIADPNEAARGALGAIHALRSTLAPPYPISEACEVRRSGRGEEAAVALAALIASGEDHARDGRGRKLRLRWGALEPADMDALLQGMSKPSDSSPPVAFPSSELDKLRDLPVWKTLSGKRVAVDRTRHFSLAEGGDVADLPLPPGASDRLLAPSPELSDLIRDIGVEQVTQSGVVARFVLPELGTVPPEDRLKLLQHVRANWAELKQDESLVTQFKEVAFIPVKGVPTKASSLFDPRTDVLKDIFGDEPDAFPQGEFAEDGWLDVLVDIGLRNKLDKETILQCAQKVESQRADPLPSAVEARASLLMRHINRTAGEGDLYNNQFLTKLSHIRFVPVHTPPPARRPEEDDGIFVSGSNHGGDGDDGDGAAGAGEAWSQGVVLMRFDEAAVPKDRNLVFTAFPVHMAGLVPPQLFWSLLKIQSPPQLEVVLRHIRIVTERYSQLDRWTYSQPPVKVFQSLFEFLDDNWSKLSPGVVKGLKDRPLVPVGARLIKAGRLFFRLKENLSPFMFEVPRAFGAFDSLFKNLGTTQAPMASDYAVFLKELAGECGSQALNPNELGAVLKVLSLLAAELEVDTTGELSTDIYVPDEKSELVPWGLCLHNDSPSLAGRVDPSRLRFLHPRVNLEDCRRLRIPSVSQVVKEELELGFTPEPFEEEGALQAQLSATLLSKDFSLAVAVLVKSFSPEYASVGVGGSSAADGGGGGGGGGQGGRTFEARAHAAAARLEGFAVVFVEELRSRFLRLEVRGGGVRGEEDITAAHGVTGSLFFVQEATKTILIARGSLPDAFPPSYAVAMAVSKVVALSSAAIGPLSVLLATTPDLIEGFLGALQAREGAVTGDELTRGLPGEPLTAGDKTLLELKPLKAFLPGEVIAWEDKPASRSGSDAGNAAAASVMRYGVVINGGSAEAGEAGADDEDFPADGRGSGRVGQGLLRRVRVKLTPGRIDTMLSTQVYSFRQARAGAASSPSIVAHAAKMLRRIAGGDVGGGDEGVEEEKGVEGAAGGRGGAGSVVSSAQLLDAVNDILGKADLSLSMEQGQMLKEGIKQKDEARVAQAELERARAEVEQLDLRIKRMDKAFLCSICFTNDVDTVLAPCGHMLCSSCKGSLGRQRKCPFCRESWTATAPFRRPGAEDVSDDEELD